MSYVDRFFPPAKTEDEKCEEELDELMRVKLYGDPNPNYFEREKPANRLQEVETLR